MGMKDTHVHFVANALMVIIQVQMGKNIIEDLFLDGSTNVNIITKHPMTSSTPNTSYKYVYHNPPNI
jgi:hypothetical protein